jgi:phytoene synthase
MQATERTNAPRTNEDDWLHCEAVAKEHGRSFYVASRFLPTDRRRAIHAIYAFCRVADDIVDRAECPIRAGAALDKWAEQLDYPVDAVPRAFASARDDFGVPIEPARDLIEGVRRDLEPRWYQTWTDLREYCHSVAGTVGLMAAPVLGCRDSHALTHAAELGVAMQLTNILRDVAEDAERGRVYLPVSELEAYGCDPQSVLAGRPNGQFRDLVAFQIERARGLYAQAREGIPALTPAGRFTTLAASHFYAGILREIEAQDLDPFRGRARVTSARKVRSLPRVAVSFIEFSVRAVLL